MYVIYLSKKVQRDFNVFNIGTNDSGISCRYSFQYVEKYGIKKN